MRRKPEASRELREENGDFKRNEYEKKTRDFTRTEYVGGGEKNLGFTRTRTEYEKEKPRLHEFINLQKTQRNISKTIILQKIVLEIVRL